MIERYEKSNHTLVIDRTGPKPVVYRIPKGVPFRKKVTNFTRAAVKHVQAGRPKTSEELIAKRFSICESCQFLNTDKMECLACGCGIKSVRGPFSKLAWADSKCPEKKW